MKRRIIQLFYTVQITFILPMIVIFTAPLEYSPYCQSIFIVPLLNKVACSRYVQIHNHPSLPNGSETAPTCICLSEAHPGCLKTK